MVKVIPHKMLQKATRLLIFLLWRNFLANFLSAVRKNQSPFSHKISIIPTGAAGNVFLSSIRRGIMSDFFQKRPGFDQNLVKLWGEKSMNVCAIFSSSLTYKL
jgi:hypothetical protein